MGNVGSAVTGLSFDDDGDASPSERQWLLAPIVCTILLMAAVVAGLYRAIRLLQTRNSVSSCHWLSARWAVRITAWGALVAGLVGMLYAARRFYLHWSSEEVPIILESLMLLAYCLMIFSLLLASCGLRWQGIQKAYRAFRQASKASLLAGLAAGIAAEVLCDVGEPAEKVPLALRQTCAMLGGSCGLVLLGLAAAQADGQAEREPIDGLPPRALNEDQAPDPESTIRHDSITSQISDAASLSRIYWPNFMQSSEPVWNALPVSRSGDGGALREPLLSTPGTPSTPEHTDRPMFPSSLSLSTDLDDLTGRNATPKILSHNVNTQGGKLLRSGSELTQNNTSRSPSWSSACSHAPREPVFLSQASLHTVLAT